MTSPRSSREGSRSPSATSRPSKHLELDIPEGAFFVLLGPSGAGKTTTLRVIAGLEKPDTGTRAPDRDRRDAGHPGRARPGDGVPELRAVPEADRGAEHRVAAARAQAAQVRDRRAGQARAELLHIEELLNRNPAQMSGGQMQRVALGRALVRDPRAFLMDEPLTNLDLKLRVEMRTELTRIHRSLGRTFLYVTNDQVEAMSMADQVAVLREGTVQQVGSPTEIYDRPANRWVATFVGSPRMNLLKCTANGRLEGKGWSLPNPGFGVQGDRPALLRRALRGPVTRRARGVGVADRQGLRRRAARRPHARRHRGRRSAGDHQGAADGVVQDRRQGPRRRRHGPRPPVRRRIGVGDRDDDDRRPAPSGPEAGADPRACLSATAARRSRSSRPSTPSRRSPSTATSSCSPGRGCSSACAAARARCPTRGRGSRPAWNARVREAAHEKDAIALRARELVEDGSTIFVDASSTGLALARALELRPPTELTLVTNSPAIALGLTADTIHVIVPPGELNQHMRVLTGRWTVDFLRRAQHRRGVHLGRGDHARARADDVAQRAGRHAQRGGARRRRRRSGCSTRPSSRAPRC